MTDFDSLNLSLQQLGEVRDALAARIGEGLNAEGKQIRALLSYFGAPQRSVSGEALVIDTGGTNMRAAVVAVADGKARVVAGPLKRTLPVRTGHALSGEEFFAAQASLVTELGVRSSLPVGYCFSYPSENSPDRDSRLLRWTKGIDIPGVEGTLVGSQLGLALRKQGYAPGAVRVLNDTVASMLGGAFAHQGMPSERSIGLIVGTGNNMAGFFDSKQSNKVPSDYRGKMAINLESGNFHPPHLSAWDDAVDRASDNPGFQRFEKAVSGFYLPFLFAQALPEYPGLDPSQGTGWIVAMRDGSERGPAQALATALLARSADLVAASLAGVVAHYEPSPEPVGILAEGTFFWGDPAYATRVESTLAQLIPEGYRATILATEEANLIGSAVAALEG